MSFTGETVHGWRIATLTAGRRPPHATGLAAWVDEVVIELVKGDRHIHARGQHGIDPQVVLGRAITSALLDDLRDARERGAYEEGERIALAFLDHERTRKLRESGYAAGRVLGQAARFQIAPARGR